MAGKKRKNRRMRREVVVFIEGHVSDIGRTDIPLPNHTQAHSRTATFPKLLVYQQTHRC